MDRDRRRVVGGFDDRFRATAADEPARLLVLEEYLFPESQGTRRHAADGRTQHPHALHQPDQLVRASFMMQNASG